MEREQNYERKNLEDLISKEKDGLGRSAQLYSAKTASEVVLDEATLLQKQPHPFGHSF